MRNYKPTKAPKIREAVNDQVNNEDDEDKVDYNGIEVVVDRVEHGLIGTLRIEDNINKPLLKVNDMAHIRATSRPFIKDMVLYKSHDEFFLRRIIKIKEDTAYVAGDSEKSYHIIHRSEIVGKVIGRERNTKFLSFGLNPKKRMYTFTKVNLAPFRLGNRITNYEQDINNESLEIAQQALLESQQQENTTIVKNQASINIDADLSSFLDPDALVKELKNSKLPQDSIDNYDEAIDNTIEEVIEEVYEEFEEGTETEENSQEVVDETTNLDSSDEEYTEEEAESAEEYTEEDSDEETTEE